MKIGQIGIPVTDVERATAFYQEKLELPLLFKAPPGLAFFQCGDIRLMLDASSGEHAGQGTVIYFKKEEMESWYHDKLKEGILFVRSPHLVAKMPDHELWMCFLKDPDGNLIGIMEERN